MFDYLIETRARFLAKFRELGWAEFERNREATWGSMLGIFLHLLDDEEGWLQYAARGRSIVDAPDRNVAAYATFDQVAEDDRNVGAQTRSFLQGLRRDDLAREVEFRESSGSTRRRMDRILTHAFVDEVAHVGELVCLLWQMNVKPPYLDWLDHRQS